jgi:hypothetical protein
MKEEERKSRVLQIRLDENQMKIIDTFCKREGITRSEYMRILIDKDFFSRGLYN